VFVHNHEYSNRIRIIIKEEIDMKGKNILYTTSIIFGFSLAFATNPITTCANWHDNPFFKLNVGYGFPEKLVDKHAGVRENKKPSNAMSYNIGWGYKLTNNLLLKVMICDIS
jgi:hypothetical protein